MRQREAIIEREEGVRQINKESDRMKKAQRTRNKKGKRAIEKE
jgi:hypothetical protein